MKQLKPTVVHVLEFGVNITNSPEAQSLTDLMVRLAVVINACEEMPFLIRIFDTVKSLTHAIRQNMWRMGTLI